MKDRMRPIGIVVGFFLVLAVASCGSGSGDAPEQSATPTPTLTPKATRDADGFTPAEREVVDAAERYTTAILNYQKGDRGVDLTKVATKELADSIAVGVKAEFDDKGKVLIGDNRFTAESVKLNGDKARFRGCSDFSRVREDGTWVVSDPMSVAKHC